MLAHQAQYPGFHKLYNQVVKNQWEPHEQQQKKKLQKMIRFAYNNIPYYHNLFKKLNLHPCDINNIKDLQKLPILTKEIIRKDPQAFQPQHLPPYIESTTGGSTGKPFSYLLSKDDRFLGAALLYRGWGYAGYQPGDKMVFLAGASLEVGTKPTIIKKVHEITRNTKQLSSFDMGEEDMQKYTEIINTFKPEYIRGYASSIYFYAKWLQKNNIEIQTPKTVFTTAEKLFPHMRKTINEVFDCEVFDGYGLNDGGISAFECPEHNGLHISTERSILEVIDGNILATNITNHAMPFIRYQTGDIGQISEETCSCGRKTKLLKEISGRQLEMLLTPEGKYVNGAFFLYIFWEISNVKEFQVIQKTLHKIIIKMVVEDDFDEKQLEHITSLTKTRSEEWDIEFHIVDQIERTQNGKYRFIISELRT